MPSERTTTRRIPAIAQHTDLLRSIASGSPRTSRVIVKRHYTSNLASTPRSSLDVKQFTPITPPPVARVRYQHQAESATYPYELQAPVVPVSTNKEKCITCTSLHSAVLNPPQYCSASWLTPDFIASAKGRYSLLLITST